MKKSIYLLGMAVAALSSCSQSDVVEMPENRAIQFNSFVNKNTRDVTEVTTLTGGFYVLGYYGSEDNWQTVYNNEASTITHYWVASQPYEFGAYYDGTSTSGITKNSNVSFDPDTKTLTFTGYTPDDSKDLLAATASHTTDNDVTDEAAVHMIFEHMLSQVKFTFKTTDADAYKLEITDLTISNAVNKATGKYTADTNTGDGSVDGTIDWTTDPTKGVYTYGNINDVADASQGYVASVRKLVIPQGSTNNITVTFKAKVSGAGMPEKENTFTATLGYDAKDTPDTKGTDNTWTPGFRYNYIATINADMIDPNLQDQKIEFTTEVESWEDAHDTETTPTPQP